MGRYHHALNVSRLRFRAFDPTASYSELDACDLRWYDWADMLDSDLQRLFTNREGKFIIDQWTGVEDKNGIDIYERDILAGKNGQVLGFAIWSKKLGSFLMTSVDGDPENPELSYSLFYTPNEWKRLEVVGNLTDHSHLIKEACELS